MPAVMNKASILEEINRTAAQNGGKPLGSIAFRSETGIKASDWSGVYWARWSDALIEAGFAPNQFQAPTDNETLAKFYADLAKELGHLPVEAELKLKRRRDRKFPSEGVFRRFRNKRELVRVVADYCKANPGLEDVVDWCDDYLARSKLRGDVNVHDEAGSETLLGSVYLAKSGRYYKIGKSNAAGRREYEIGLQLPEKLKMVHVIKTDDPTGIEAYWHKRFEASRKNGEWFELKPKEVAAFKLRRKFM